MPDELKSSPVLATALTVGAGSAGPISPHHPTPQVRRPGDLVPRKAQPVGLLCDRHRQRSLRHEGCPYQAMVERAGTGQNTKPTMARRQMYGRAKLDLLLP